MTPSNRIPYHGSVIEGAQDQDNFVRNLITILQPGWWVGGVNVVHPGPSPLSGSAPALFRQRSLTMAPALGNSEKFPCWSAAELSHLIPLPAIRC